MWWIEEDPRKGFAAIVFTSKIRKEVLHREDLPDRRPCSGKAWRILCSDIRHPRIIESINCHVENLGKIENEMRPANEH